MKPYSLLAVALVVVTTAATCEDPTAPDTCITGRTLTVGTTISESVAGGDCALEGRHADSYAFTLTAQTMVRFHITSGTETEIRIRDNAKTAPDNEVMSNGSGLTDYMTFVVLPTGSYTLDVAAEDDGDKADYTVETATIPAPNPAGCIQPPAQRVYTTIGVTAEGAIGGGDCVGSQPQYHYDNFNVYLPKTTTAPRKITVTTSGAMAVEVRVMDTPTMINTPTARNDAGTLTVQFPVATSGYYSIGLIGTISGSVTSITYTIKVE